MSSSEREYEVIGPHRVMGHTTGEKFKAVWVHPALLGVHLKQVSKDEPLRCPYCAEHGKPAEKKATYADLLALREHYTTDHPGLAAPTE
jgi:hypothetical protein